ncbi:MAG: cytochrome c family protein [Pseudomonadota bacterium]|nr:cytochrome c family protein [Sphingomonas sp.]MDQ3478090.1 cytochrome c family protein [Pseudomonadota bacterium]
MDNRFNTTSGWVLFALIVALGSTIVAGEVFHSERPEKMGYPIAGVVEPGEDGAGAEQPIAVYLASADAAKGEASFKKCAACHNAAPGGAHALGPNLHAIMGAPVAGKPGFAYSEALKGKGGTWTWEAMSEWLKSPKGFAPGTKMTFAGLGDPQERANLMVWLNSQGSSLPIPAAPAPTAEPGAGPGDGAQKAEKQPVVNATGAADPKGGGEADPQQN